MGNLHTLWLELLNELDHLLDVVQVLPMHDQIHGESNWELANLLGKDELIGMTSGACDPLRRLGSRILKTQLDMVEPSVNQLRQPRLGNSQAGSDEVGIKAGLPSACHQLFEIGACRRLASSQMQVKNAKATRLLKHADPFCGGKFGLRRYQLQQDWSNKRSAAGNDA